MQKCIVTDNMALVVHLANRIWHKWSALRAVHHGEREDWLQNAVVSCLRAASRYDPQRCSTPGALLGRVIINEARLSVSKANAGIRMAIRQATPISEHALEMSARHPSDEVHCRMEAARRLARVPEPARTVAWRHLAIGDELKDIAADMGVTRERVRQLCAGALLRMLSPAVWSQTSARDRQRRNAKSKKRDK